MKDFRNVFKYKKGDLLLTTKYALVPFTKSLKKTGIDVDSLPVILGGKAVENWSYTDINNGISTSLVKCMIDLPDSTQVELIISQLSLFPISLEASVRGFIHYAEMLEESGKLNADMSIPQFIHSLDGLIPPVFVKTVKICEDVTFSSELLPKGYNYTAKVLSKPVVKAKVAVIQALIPDTDELEVLPNIVTNFIQLPVVGGNISASVELTEDRVIVKVI